MKRSLVKVICTFAGFLLVMGIGINIVWAEKKVEIVYGSWMWLEPASAKLLEGWVKEFEKENPQITIKKMTFPFAKYDDNVMTMLKAGAGPDVFYVTAFNFRAWAKAGYFAPLSDYMDLSKYRFVSLQDRAVIDGKTYGLLYDFLLMGGLVYVKSYLERAGVEVPRTPEQFIEAIEKLDAYAKETEEFTFAFIHPFNLANPGYLMQGGMIVVNGFGGLVVRNGKFGVNDSRFIDGVKFLKRIYDLKAMAVGMEFGAQRKAYLKDEAAMVLDGVYWPLKVKFDNPKLYEDLGVVEPPFPCRYTPYEEQWYAINANSPEEKKKAGAKWLEFRYQPERMIEWTRAVGTFSALEAGVDLAIKEFPWMATYADAMPYSADVVVPGFEKQTMEIRKIIADYISKSLTEELSVEEAMNRCQSELERRFY